ncbi:MAG: septum formation family protein [Actinomycetota bacterium]|nr:septum formation family protein [Actinomycetota bacterium]
MSTDNASPDEPAEPDEPADDEPVESEEEPAKATPPPPPRVERPTAGDCVRLRQPDVLSDVLVGLPEPSRCRGATGQYVSVRALSPAMRRAATSSDVDALSSLTSTRCRQDALGWLGTDNEGLEISQFRSLPSVPLPDEVAAGAGFVACTTYVIKRRTALLRLTRSTEQILDSRRGLDYSSCARAAITNAGNATQVCSIKHNWRAVASARLGEPDDTYPGDRRLRARMQGICEVAVGNYVDTTGTYEYGYTWPTRQTWSDDDRFGLCYTKTPD